MGARAWLAGALLVGCHGGGPTAAGAGAEAGPGTATATETGTATGSVPEAAPASEGGPDAGAEAAFEAGPAVRPVSVQNIGIHIGGGPNDDATKAPIASSVAPHLAELAACWSHVGDAGRGGDFGVDLLVPAGGGRAAVSHPRTSLGPDAFRDCVVGVFEAIEFARPRGGRTTASYALRFTPRPSP